MLGCPILRGVHRGAVGLQPGVGWHWQCLWWGQGCSGGQQARADVRSAAQGVWGRGSAWGALSAPHRHACSATARQQDWASRSKRPGMGKADGARKSLRGAALGRGSKSGSWRCAPKPPPSLCCSPPKALPKAGCGSGRAGVRAASGSARSPPCPLFAGLTRFVCGSHLHPCQSFG